MRGLKYNSFEVSTLPTNKLCLQASVCTVPKFQIATACFSCIPPPPSLTSSKFKALGVKAIILLVLPNYLIT